MRIEASVLEAPSGRPREDDGGDTRFRSLMRAEDWESLPAAIRRRFSKRLANGATALYAGEVLETTMSRMGWLWAQVLQLIGGPLPLTRNRHVPAVVVVTEDHACRGQIWTRLYGRPGRFAQVVQSTKRFAGPTGLEEYVGYGVGMTLTVEAREGALIFRSRDYFIELFGSRWRLPGWLAPGDTIVTHAELPDGRFSFTLQLIHPLLGHMIRQMAMFREVVT
jgi:Domain of unknown function (DUF4166)